MKIEILETEFKKIGPAVCDWYLGMWALLNLNPPAAIEAIRKKMAPWEITLYLAIHESEFGRRIVIDFQKEIAERGK